MTDGTIVESSTAQQCVNWSLLLQLNYVRIALAALAGTVAYFALGFLLHNYVSLNIGLRLALLQAAAYFVQWLGASVVIALIYRPARTVTQR